MHYREKIILWKCLSRHDWIVNKLSFSFSSSILTRYLDSFFLLADVTERPICGLFCQHESLADNIFSSLFVALDIDLLYSSSWNCLLIYSFIAFNVRNSLCSSSCLLLSAARDWLHLSESLCESQMGRDPDVGWFLKAPLRLSPLLPFPWNGQLVIPVVATFWRKTNMSESLYEFIKLFCIYKFHLHWHLS